MTGDRAVVQHDWSIFFHNIQKAVVVLADLVRKLQISQHLSQSHSMVPGKQSSKFTAQTSDVIAPFQKRNALEDTAELFCAAV